MNVEIENPTKIQSSFAKKDGTGFWYTSSQEALLFKEGMKYPDKFELQLSFSDSEQDSNNSKPFPAGKYELHESAFYIDNRDHLQINAEKLVLIKS